MPNPVGIVASTLVADGSLTAKRAGAVADRSWPRRYRQPGLGLGDPGSHSPQDPSISMWLGVRDLISATLVVHGLFFAPRVGFCVLMFAVSSFRARTPSAAN